MDKQGVPPTIDYILPWGDLRLQTAKHPAISGHHHTASHTTNYVVVQALNALPIYCLRGPLRARPIIPPPAIDPSILSSRPKTPPWSCHHSALMLTTFDLPTHPRRCHRWSDQLTRPDTTPDHRNRPDHRTLESTV